GLHGTFRPPALPRFVAALTWPRMSEGLDRAPGAGACWRHGTRWRGSGLLGAPGVSRVRAVSRARDHRRGTARAVSALRRADRPRPVAIRRPAAEDVPGGPTVV